jgi:hypothetical protein
MKPEPMSQGMKLVKFCGEEPTIVARTPSPQVELKHFQNVIGNVTQDALNVWAEIWGELQHGVHTGVTIASEAEKGSATATTERSGAEPFKPSCGWPEFMEKMWLLRHYLDFLARFSRQGE